VNFYWIIGGLAALAVVGILFAVGSKAAARASGLLPPNGRATMTDVVRLARTGHKTLAMHYYRQINKTGLAEAKKAVDDLSTPPYTESNKPPPPQSSAG
jgi:ribosomal protein L7/L12